MGFIKDKRINRKLPLSVQEKLLNKHYPESLVKRNKEHYLNWIGKFKPTAISQVYTVLVRLQNNDLGVFVISPKKLKLFKNEKYLPHVYSTPKQKLCLFFGKREWNRSMLISDTIIPWISDWLYYYELWLITGEWLGGGTVHDVENKINTEN